MARSRDFGVVTTSRLRALLTFAAVLIVSSSARAEGERRLSLRAAIEHARGASPTFRARTADRDRASGIELGARGLDDTGVVASADYTALHPFGPDAGSAISRTAGGSVGVVQPLPTGGSVSLSVGVQSVTAGLAGPIGISTGAFASRFVTTTPGVTAAGLLTISHPLLRGAGVAVARAPQRRARIDVGIAEARRSQEALNLVRDVTLAYWEVSFAERQLEIRLQAHRAATDQLAMVHENIAVGKMPASAVAEVEVVVAQRASDRAAAENERGRRAGELIALIADDADDLATTEPIGAPQEAQLDDHALLARVDVANLDLRALRDARRLAQVDLDVAQNARLPQVELAVSGGPLRTWLDASADAGTGSLTGMGVGVGLRILQSVPNRTAAGAVAAASATADRAAADEAALRARLRAQAIGLAAAVASTRQQVEVLEPALAAAERDYEAERARFSAGRGTSFDVLRRQDTIAQVGLRRERALVDHAQARAAIAALIGTTPPLQR